MNEPADVAAPTADCDFFATIPAADLTIPHVAPAEGTPTSEVNWRQVHTQTRVRATVTTFGWPTKLVLCSPPFAMFVYLAYLGLFRTPLLALAWGVPLFAASVWWSTQIWTRGRPLAAFQRAARRSPTDRPTRRS